MGRLLGRVGNEKYQDCSIVVYLNSYMYTMIRVLDTLLYLSPPPPSTTSLSARRPSFST